MTNRAPISVLIVDDNEAVAQAVARRCAVDDLSVIGVVATGQQAIEAVRAQAPDVVLMDYRLGGETGPAIARELLEIVPASRIVIVTGAASATVHAEARDAGCVGCVEKTMDFARSVPDVIRRAHRGEPI